MRCAKLDRKSGVATGSALFLLALLLWSSGCGESPDLYIRQLKSLQASERTKAANELIRFDADEVVPLLVQEAQSGYIRVRFEVVGLLGRFKDPRGIPALIAALDDKSPNVAARAALALGQMHVVEALPALLKYARFTGSGCSRKYSLPSTNMVSISVKFSVVSTGTVRDAGVAPSVFLAISCASLTRKEMMCVSIAHGA